MNVAILGSGGREYAIGQSLKSSKKIDKIFFIPGNGGTSVFGENLSVQLSEFQLIADEIVEKGIELVVVGPEVPLINGVVDYLEAKKIDNLKIIGPSKQGAMLEGSKVFAKEFMQKYNIPTAKHESFNKSNYQQAIKFMETLNPPYVIKASGPAAGKGVLIIDDIDTAKLELKNIFSGKFGDAGENVVIEEFLDGLELSVFVLTDGENYKILPQAKDYKRIFDDNKGLNTGGMGAVSPVPFSDAELNAKIEEKIIKPTIKGLQNEKIKYKGFIFLGLIKVNNEPFVIEYNVRLGDPETQSVLPRIKTDLADLFLATANQTLSEINIEEDNRFALTVVAASGGYPENYEKDKQIYGLEQTKNCIVVHAGTKKINNNFYTSGGRVLSVTALANSIDEARKIAYGEIEKINFVKIYFRKDIGIDLY